MKKYLLSLLMVLATVFSGLAEKLPKPIWLKETKFHVYTFDYESFHSTGALSGAHRLYSWNNYVIFDGETIKFIDQDSGKNVIIHSVDYFTQTEDNTTGAIQYLITIDDPSGVYSTSMEYEIQIIPQNRALVKWLRCDDTGMIFDLWLWECDVLHQN